MQYRFLVLVALVCCTGKIFGQERLGIATSNYAGTNAMMLNPASMVESPFKWDFNIATAHAYFDNNGAYLQDANLIKLMSNQKDMKLNNAEFQSTGDNPSDYYLINLFRNSLRKKFYFTSMVQGPSLIYSKDDWSFGFHTAVRAAASMRGLSNETKNLFYQGLTYDPLQDDGEVYFPRFRVNQTTWNEIGFSLGKVLKKERYRKIKGAFTVKRLRGYNSAFFQIKNADVEVASDSSLYVLGLKAEYGYAPNAEASDDFSEYIRNPVGKGFGFDVGIVIEDSEPRKAPVFNIQCPHWDCVEKKLYYNWRLGISLIDVGYMRFKNSARKYVIESNSTSEEIFEREVKNIEDYEDIDSLIASSIYREVLPREAGNTFSTMTPWALSAQFDYYLGGNFFINSTIVQSLPKFGWAGIERANTLSVTPRFDQKRFGFAVPIVLYDYLYPRIGAALRINNFLVIGTDKIGSIIGNKLNGGDIYFSLKINRLKKCGKSNRYNYINRVFESLSD